MKYNYDLNSRKIKLKTGDKSVLKYLFPLSVCGSLQLLTSALDKAVIF